MAITGLFLCSFLIIHLLGNLQIFKQDHGLAFNQYAVLMTTNPFIKLVSYVLYISILYHAIKGLLMTAYNRSARLQGYAVNPGNATSAWSSRNMGILGTIVLIFLVVHMSDFWFQYKFGHIPYTQYDINNATGDVQASAFTGQLHEKMTDRMATADTRVIVAKDLYMEVYESFKEWWLVLLYVIAMAALAFHLTHGFKSAFQTLGLNHRKYNRLIHWIGVVGFGILIPIAFAAMPIYCYFRG